MARIDPGNGRKNKNHKYQCSDARPKTRDTDLGLMSIIRPGPSLSIAMIFPPSANLCVGYLRLPNIAFTCL